MEWIRGWILMLFGFAAVYRGFRSFGTRPAWLAFGLGAAALALGVWHLLRSARRPSA